MTCPSFIYQTTEIRIKKVKQTMHNAMTTVFEMKTLTANKLQAGGRHDMPPPRPAAEARSGSLEPGRPSRAGRAGPDQPMRAIQPAGRTRRPPTGCTRQTSDSIIA